MGIPKRMDFPKYREGFIDLKNLEIPEGEARSG
jgi:hypothetical protein